MTRGRPAERIELTELAPPVPAAISDATASALHQSGLVRVERPPGVAAYLIGSAGHVGVALVGGVEVHVRPKVPVERLVFLLTYGAGPAARWGEVGLSAAPDLLPAVATVFALQVERALVRGPLKGYREVEESAAVLRGRLRLEDQLARRSGVLVPLEVRYDEWTVDVAENRLLLGACHRLLRLPGVDLRTRRLLTRSSAVLADVSRLTPGQLLPRWEPTRLNAAYQPALRLAELVLLGGSFEQHAGGLRVDGFMVNMASVFEAFVTRSLRKALRDVHGGRASLQDSGHLDEAGRIDMRPDLVWYGEDGRPAAVVDAKYKAEKPSGYANADVYQMLAYCTALALPLGHLVYARGNEPVQEHVLRGSGVVVRQHALDLTATPEALLQSVRLLATSIAADSGCRRR